MLVYDMFCTSKEGSFILVIAVGHWCKNWTMIVFVLYFRLTFRSL